MQMVGAEGIEPPMPQGRQGYGLLLSLQSVAPKLEEGGGIEPHWLITSPRFSGPLADHSAAPSIVKELGSRGGIRTRTVLFLRQTPPANWASPAWTTRTESNRESSLCRRLLGRSGWSGS